MKAIRLYSVWLLLQSAFLTMATSMGILCRAFANKLPRQEVDACVRQWSSRLLSITKTSTAIHQVEHAQFLPRRSYIIMSNHASLYDIPLIFVSLPGSIRMLAKKELFRIPFFGRAMRKAEFISIDRQNRAQALQDLERARQKMEDGIALWIAPEGTRSRHKGQLLPLKKGGFTLAIQAQAVILPVGIRGADQILAAGTYNLQANQHVDVYVGEPVDTAGLSLGDRDNLMEKIADRLCHLAALEKY